MTEILYMIGDATHPSSSGPTIIAHICNDAGGWGAGFTGALSRMSLVPETAYRAWFRDRHHRSDNPFALGEVQTVKIDDNLFVANMIAQVGKRRLRSNPPPISYPHVLECLTKLTSKALALQASVHMPRIGCGLAGGKWDVIKPLIQATLCAHDVPVLVYSLQRRKS